MSQPPPQDPYGQQDPYGRQDPAGQSPPPGQQPPPGPPGPYGGQTSGAGGGSDPVVGGFVSALTDLSFRSYVTPYIVRFVYLIAIALGVLWWVSALIISFSQEPILGVLVLIVGPVALVLWIALLRMTLEFYHAITTMSLHVRGLSKEG